MNAQIRHWLGTVGWFVQLLGGTFCQESDYPTFYHLAVLDYKPCYSQEPWPEVAKKAMISCLILYRNDFQHWVTSRGCVAFSTAR